MLGSAPLFGVIAPQQLRMGHGAVQNLVIQLWTEGKTSSLSSQELTLLLEFVGGLGSCIRIVPSTPGVQPFTVGTSQLPI